MPGINRNIMECKVSSIRFRDISPVAVLIETLWNVKESRSQQ